MYKFKIRFSILILVFCIKSFELLAQKDSIKYSVSLVGVSSTGQYSPFWLHSNQYGKVLTSPSSTNLNLGINKEFGNSKNLFKYGFCANALVQTDYKNTSFYFNELYAKLRLSVFDLVIGAREEQFGNQDSTLSSGGFMFSKNSRPMPKITIGIEQFIAVPFTHGYIEIKGAISNGWFMDNNYIQNEMLHHKYGYARLGGKLPIHFQYGLEHTALWAGNIQGIGQQPTGINSLISIFLARNGGQNASIGEQINTLGDHRISQSMKLDVDVSNYKLSAYWQNFSEDGPIYFMTNSINIPDGLWGFSVRNKKFPIVKALLYEYLNTTDQTGPYLQKDGVIYGGGDSYFINYIYITGWNNNNRTIGTPFISSPLYNKDNTPLTNNNRVQVHHVGIEGEIVGYNFRALSSFSKNYGTYSTPTNIQNTSALLEINRRFPQLSNIELGCSLGADFGKLYGNSYGLQVTLKKTGDIFNY